MQGNPRKSETWAMVIQNTLRQYGPMDFDTLVQRTKLEPQQVRQGLRASRRSLDESNLANEIVCTARMASGEHVYFLAESDAAADKYELQRRAIALGHLNSVILLEEKRSEKWPNPQRAAAIKMLEMAQQLLATAP